GAFSEVAKLVVEDGEPFDQLGQAVALHGDTAVLGMWSHNDEPGGTPPSPKQGSVHLFSRSASGWSRGVTLAASDGSDDNSFGWDVAYDGSTLLIGADADASVSEYQGSAYFYANDT